MKVNEYEEKVIELMKYANTVRDMFANLKSNDCSHASFLLTQTGLIRLYASFQAIYFLVAQGYAIESIVLARFIHEQLAYMYSLRLIDDLNKIERLKVTKCISKYKERIEYIGNVYGMTSEFAHLDMKFINLYLKNIDFKNKRITVLNKFNDKEIGYTMLFTLVMTVELYLDMIFVFLDVDGLRNNNIELSHKADKIKINFKDLIERIKILVNN
jgi:hypothetical protein